MSAHPWLDLETAGTLLRDAVHRDTGRNSLSLGGAAIHAEAAEWLVAEVERLRGDAARLDWLATYGDWIVQLRDGASWAVLSPAAGPPPVFTDYRVAIDEAMRRAARDPGAAPAAGRAS